MPLNGRPYISERINSDHFEYGATYGPSSGPGFRLKQAALRALGALTPAADRLAYFTSDTAAALATLTAFARTLLDDADAATARTTLGAAPLASPTFTGVPAGPTAAPGTDTTQFATTAFVKAAIDVVLGGVSASFDTLAELAAAIAALPTFASGVWTPTTVNVTNAAASTGYEGQYLRVGNTVTCSVKIDATPTAGESECVIGIPLPIASNLGDESDCVGAGAYPGDGVSCAIRGDATNNRAELAWVQASTTARTFFCTFTYQVI